MRLDRSTVILIRGLCDWLSCIELARRFGVHRSTVHRIKRSAVCKKTLHMVKNKFIMSPRSGAGSEHQPERQMNEEMIVIEWEISDSEQAEMDWWEQHPNATEKEFWYAGF